MTPSTQVVAPFVQVVAPFVQVVAIETVWDWSVGSALG
jgi:hypothetical protein